MTKIQVAMLVVLLAVIAGALIVPKAREAIEQRQHEQEREIERQAHDAEAAKWREFCKQVRTPEGLRACS
jgi:hypothetical protein